MRLDRMETKAISMKATGCYLRPLEDRVQPPVIRDPGEGALNGLITNDKFCLTRMGQLSAESV